MYACPPFRRGSTGSRELRHRAAGLRWSVLCTPRRRWWPLSFRRHELSYNNIAQNRYNIIVIRSRLYIHKQRRHCLCPPPAAITHIFQINIFAIRFWEIITVLSSLGIFLIFYNQYINTYRYNWYTQI